MAQNKNIIGWQMKKHKSYGSMHALFCTLVPYSAKQQSKLTKFKVLTKAWNNVTNLSCILYLFLKHLLLKILRPHFMTWTRAVEWSRWRAKCNFERTIKKTQHLCFFFRNACPPIFFEGIANSLKTLCQSLSSLTWHTVLVAVFQKKSSPTIFGWHELAGTRGNKRFQTFTSRSRARSGIKAHENNREHSGRYL